MICVKSLKSNQCEQMRAPTKMRRVVSQNSMKSPEEEVLESGHRGHVSKFWSR